MLKRVSPTHPYERVMEGYNLLRGIEEIPRKIITYLLDMPLEGYEPPDDNEYPRCRLAKYLFHDGADALNQRLPTPKEKLGLIYDPVRPDQPPSGKGYRIYPQSYVGQSQTDAQTLLRVSMGRTIARDSFTSELSIVFTILCSVAYEPKAVGMSRSLAMEQAILEALNGVNMMGVGTFYFDRQQHPDCGSHPIGDRGTNVGRSLIMGLTWKSE